MHVWSRNNNSKAYDLSSLSVLLVEDNKHMQVLLKEILRSLNLGHIETADDGADAIKLFNETQPDLIITDWNMSPVNGIELADMIRKDEDSVNPFVPIIMLTSNTEFQHVKTAINHGINEFLAKPISAASLYSRIVSVIENPRRFVRVDGFTGPDRRRRSHAKSGYEGKLRREDDASGVTNLTNAVRTLSPDELQAVCA